MRLLVSFAKEDITLSLRAILSPMHYVYLIESVHDCHRHYVGQTHDLKARLHGPNSGDRMHTARYRPWHLVCYLGFADEVKALAFEHYLKSGSGKTFLKRHFL